MAAASLAAEPVVGAHGLLIAFAAQGDLLALGQLTGVLSDLLHPASRKRGVLLLLAGAGLQRHLFQPDFLEGVGAARLNSRRLVRFTFAQARGAAAEVVRGLTALAAAGVLNLYSRRALAALHQGMAGWHVDGRALLLGRLASELESFAQLGLFLRLLLDSPACAAGDAEALLRGVLALEDVRDLAGQRKDLTDALPEYATAIEEGLTGEAQDSDEDEEGNLAGFVCGDDSVEYSTSEEEGPVRPLKRGMGGSGSRGGSSKRLKRGQ